MLLIKNGYVKTMAGADIPNGCVLIGDDGKILSVGENIAAPEGAQVIDAEGRLVTPGCVEGHCHAGLGAEYMTNILSAEHNESVDPLTPHMRAIDGLNPMDQALANAIAGIQVGWMEEFAKAYPRLAGNGRLIHTGEDSLYDTSMETYLRGELLTYSEQTLQIYGGYVAELAKAGGNLNEAIIDRTVKKYGYQSLEDAEENC